MEDAKLEFEAGLFVRGSIRRELATFAFTHGPFEWHEEKRWTGSRFYLRGPLETLRTIAKWVKSLEEERVA